MGKKDTRDALIPLVGLVMCGLLTNTIRNYYNPLTECHRDDQCSVRRPSSNSIYYNMVHCMKNGTIVYKLADPLVKERYYSFPLQRRTCYVDWIGLHDYIREYYQPESDDRIFCAGMNLTCDARWKIPRRAFILGFRPSWPPKSCVS